MLSLVLAADLQVLIKNNLIMKKRILKKFFNELSELEKIMGIKSD